MGKRTYAEYAAQQFVRVYLRKMYALMQDLSMLRLERLVARDIEKDNLKKVIEETIVFLEDINKEYDEDQLFVLLQCSL